MLREILKKGLDEEFVFLCKDVDKFNYISSYIEEDIVRVNGIETISSSIVEEKYGKNVLDMLKRQYMYLVLFN